MATKAWFLNPNKAAIGKKIVQKPINFINVQNKDGFNSPFAWSKSKVAPIAIKPSGVAVLAIIEIVLLMTCGSLNGNKLTSTPITMPRISGFFKIPMNVFL